MIPRDSGRKQPPFSISRPRLPAPVLQALWLACCLFWWAGSPSLLQAAGEKVGIVHSWKRIYYGELDGKERLLFAGGFDRAKPALGDLDSDGDLDLLIGTGAGRLLYFENKGTARKPDWRLAAESVRAASGNSANPSPPQPIDVKKNAAPALTDIDGDGDLDLFVGSAEGQLYYYANVGNKFLPIFELQSPDFLGESFGRNLVVSFSDLNQNGLPDLSLGNAEGEFYLLINIGTRSAPRYCVEPRRSAECRIPPRKLGMLDPEDNAVPEWVDWDMDGDKDLMVGKSDGRIAFYRNIGTGFQGQWELAEERFNIIDAGGYAAPLFRDVNGDGKPDLLLAGDGELISLYSGRSRDDGLELWLEEKNLLRITSLGRHQSRLRTTSGDLDGDGDSDLVLGTRGGQLLYYENLGRDGKVALRSHKNSILPTPQRSFSAPSLVDLDNDGDLDLVVGGRNGRLELLENVGGPKQAKWKLVDLHYARIDVGAFSTPAFLDLDGNGTQDLLMGNSLGKLILYLNQGRPEQPRFLFRTLNFGGVRISSDSAPSFFSYSTERPPDLVVGGRSGRIYSAVRNPTLTALERGGFQSSPAPWGAILKGSYSAPHFVDLTGDKRPDLLLGGGSGVLSLWRYEGANRQPLVAGFPPRRSENIVPTVPSRLAAPPAGAGAGGAPGMASFEELSLTQLDPIFTAENSAVSLLETGHNVRPAFFDANGDGKPDLVAGTAKGHLLLYQNLGPPDSPRWRQIKGEFAGYKHGRYAAPAFFDLDRDGDLDMVVGNAEGRVNYWENTGTRRRPKLKHRPNLLKEVRVGKKAVPAFADLDGDGLADMLVGNMRGRLFFFKRMPGKKPIFKLINRAYLGLDVGVNASPILAPLTGGKTTILLVGSDRGKIEVLVPRSKTGGKPAKWLSNKSYLEGLMMPLGSHPALLDLDRDGDLDLFVGGEKGSILFFRNNALVPELAGDEPPPR